MENNFDMLDENLKLLEKKLGKMYFETLNLEHFSSKGIQIISDCIYKIRKVKNANFEESDFELISKTLEKCLNLEIAEISKLLDSILKFRKIIPVQSNFSES
ncbi:MAG: hypothetical protein HUJ88_12530 [Fusobacterium necrophorum]|nr:hypothetical protein [Fusobacterium necrophorum]